MTPVRLEAAGSRSRVKQSSTEPLHSPLVGVTSVQSDVVVLLFQVRYLGCSHCAWILGLTYRYNAMLCIILSDASIFLAIRASLAETERIHSWFRV